MSIANATIGASALVMASMAAERGLGLLPVLGLPAGVAFAAGFVLLDFAGYIKHRAYHALPVLWQLHVVHHSDADMDVGTCLRHHPGD